MNDCVSGSANVVQLVDHVPPRREKEIYNGVEIIYEFNPRDKTWRFRFHIPTNVTYMDDAKDLTKARKAAHKLIDGAKGEE